ncbi:MAG: polysaccharide lyase [Cyanobacteria bacterium P01_A01_bin.135]
MKPSRFQHAAAILAAPYLLALQSCSTPIAPSTSTTQESPAQTTSIATAAVSSEAVSADPLWSTQFSADAWQGEWNMSSDRAWGEENLQRVTSGESPFPTFLRVRYPAGSASPSVSRKDNVPIGGAQFYADLGIPSQESMRLSYHLRFSPNFDFVKGGKLPGLYGGEGGSGGNIPDGRDGFSTRFMWRADGDGELYAYLPTSRRHGTSIGRGNWRFQPGVWHHLEQQIDLNQPGVADGRVRVWLDDQLVLDQSGLIFRSVEDLKLDGIFFSTFFGGGDASWATPQDTYVDFANFSISAPSAP